MFDIITFGSATRDILVTPKKLTTLGYNKEHAAGAEVCFPIGSKIDLEEIQFLSGGGGTNTAATFAKQGFKTAFYGMVGRDTTAQEIINELKQLRINTGFVQRTDKKHTNHSVVILNSGSDRTILAYRGAAELLEQKNIAFGKLKAKWLYLAPLTGLLCDSFEALVEYAHSHNMHVAANPSLAQFSLPRFAEIVKKIDVLFLNQEEAAFLTKISVEDEQNIFKKLDDMCPGTVVMTRGGEGVVASDGKHIYRAVPPEKRKVVDTTGAGDSFASGFISEFMRTQDIEKAIQLGMANSVGCISEVGAKNGLLKKGQEFERVDVRKEIIETWKL